VIGANDRIAVAVVGVGFGIGKNHLEGIHANASANNVAWAVRATFIASAGLGQGQGRVEGFTSLQGLSKGAGEQGH